ncbi:MAG TPA: phosphoglycerate kinase [Candidatus Woesebacteria bacterium]|nr:phosphoglycerate kinase [Candidatus Woesebacteria bacterium]
MKLKSVEEIIPQIRVVLRLDLDLPFFDNKIIDNSRLQKSLPTIRLLLEKKCKILIIGHRGRPNGIEDEYTLRPVYLELMSLLEPEGESLIESVFMPEINFEQIDRALAVNNLVFLENIRFWPEEENNTASFLAPLSGFCQAYVNDAFAVAHRAHASITLWQHLPSFYGLSFIEEYNHLDSLRNPSRPLTLILGGAKEDKLKHLDKLISHCDHILIGGKLPQFLPLVDPKIIPAILTPDTFDINEESIAKFTEIINNSKTIIWAGAMGFYENENYRNGTEKIARAIAATTAYKVVAGGDTSASVLNLNLKDKYDFFCSGGGVLLEFLVNPNLPAWSN